MEGPSHSFTHTTVKTDECVSAFVSPQRRFDNRRVRDSELVKRLCYECGRLLVNGEQEYQNHILSHEVANIVIQLAGKDLWV